RQKRAEAVAERLGAVIAELEAVSAAVASHSHILSHLQLPFVQASVALSPSIRELEISADWGLTSQDGFYEVERTTGNLPFRWTGILPEFRFTAGVLRDQPLAGSLALINAEGPANDAARTLRLSTAKGPVPVGFEVDDRLLLVNFTLPADSSAGSLTELVFHHDLWSPGDGDTRTLGVPFHALSLKPAA
ncbi:MAG: hypothetical protein AAGF32_10035, partial [Pseudomonadota bacterium]